MTKKKVPVSRIFCLILAVLFFLAGIYRLEEGKPVFTILTRDATEGITFIHERMPVILPNEAAEDWLNPKYHGNDILQAAITQMKFKICETA